MLCEFWPDYHRQPNRYRLSLLEKLAKIHGTVFVDACARSKDPVDPVNPVRKSLVAR
jgi:hypothetical protein